MTRFCRPPPSPHPAIGFRHDDLHDIGGQGRQRELIADLGGRESAHLTGAHHPRAHRVGGIRRVRWVVKANELVCPGHTDEGDARARVERRASAQDAIDGGRGIYAVRVRTVAHKCPHRLRQGGPVQATRRGNCQKQRNKQLRAAPPTRQPQAVGFGSCIRGHIERPLTPSGPQRTGLTEAVAARAAQKGWIDKRRASPGKHTLTPFSGTRGCEPQHLQRSRACKTHPLGPDQDHSTPAAT